MSVDQDQHAPLRDNVRLLGEELGAVLREQSGERLYDTVETIRQAAVESRSDGEMELARLRGLLDPLNDDTLLEVARAFSQFLNLANIAEQHHRERLHRRHERYPGDPDTDQGLRQVLAELKHKGIAPERIRETLTPLSVELVLTAHPTEVTRRTLIRKYDQMADLLAELDHPDLNAEEHHGLRQRLRELILSAWATDEIRRERPTPVDEAKWGFAVIEQSLWRAVPRVMRDIEAELGQAGIDALPADWVPIRFASWMGGDRDGNPNVTATTTREVLLLARWMAADLYLRDVENLLADLSMHRASDELLARTGPSHEPYRVVLRGVRDRLKVTRRRMEALVEGRPVPRGKASPKAANCSTNCYCSTARCARWAWARSPTANSRTACGASTVSASPCCALTSVRNPPATPPPWTPSPVTWVWAVTANGTSARSNASCSPSWKAVGHWWTTPSTAATGATATYVRCWKPAR